VCLHASVYIAIDVTDRWLFEALAPQPVVVG
jgi:hypothetical protein